MLTKSVIFCKSTNNGLATKRDIIKPQEDARWRVMRYKGGNAALDDMHRTSCGDDIPSLRLG